MAAILDSGGKMLTSSTDKQGANIGFPAEPEAKAHFSEMLRRIAQRLSAEDIARLVEALKSGKER